MPRWITFDHETSRGLLERLPSAAVQERPGLGALKYALQSSTAIIILPVSGPNQAAIAILRKKMISSGNFSASKTRPGGFLGLNDELVFEEEEPSQKKSWWQRLWE